MGGFMSEAVKNYTPAQEQALVEGYVAKSVSNKDFVEKVAQELGKQPKSIISKLVSLGVYKSEARRKASAPRITKKELVQDIEQHCGFGMPSLTKASKDDLQSLLDNL